MPLYDTDVSKHISLVFFYNIHCSMPQLYYYFYKHTYKCNFNLKRCVVDLQISGMKIFCYISTCMVDRSALVAGASLSAAAVACIAHAYSVKGQFYSTCIYLLQSSIYMTVLAAFVVYLVCTAASLLKTLLFGELRLIEVEHLYEYGWMTLSESFLAMTIFRNEFDARFVIVFTVVMIVKAAHWITRDRVDYLEQIVEMPPGFAPRIMSSMALMLVTNVAGLMLCAESVISNGPSMMILFGHEFAQMLVSLINISTRFVLNSNDLENGTAWEHRSIFLFYFDFAIDMTKLVMYTVFFAVVVMYYGVPLHILREMFVTVRSFVTRIKDIIRYRRATANMNIRYPEATPEEIANTDRVCIICREELVSARRLPCGHLFHYRCLRSWLERQQSCPTCRRPILDDSDGPARPANQRHAADANLQPMIWRRDRWVLNDNNQVERNAQVPGNLYPAEMRSYVNAARPNMEAGTPVIVVPQDQIAMLHVAEDQTGGNSDQASGTASQSSALSRNQIFVLKAVNSTGPVILEPVIASTDLEAHVREQSNLSSHPNSTSRQSVDTHNLSEDDGKQPLSRTASMRSISASSLASRSCASISRDDIHDETLSISKYALNLDVSDSEAQDARAKVRQKLRAELATLSRLRSEVAALNERLAAAEQDIFAHDSDQDGDGKALPSNQS